MTCDELKQLKADYKNIIIGMTVYQKEQFQKLLDTCCELHDQQCECGEELFE